MKITTNRAFKGIKGIKTDLNDINLLTDKGVRLRIVTWDQLPHLIYKLGNGNASWDRIEWDEFRRLAVGEDLGKVLPWWDKAPKFEKEE